MIMNRLLAGWFVIILLICSPLQSVRADVGTVIEIAVRQGAKVNVRSTPEINPSNVVGKALGGDQALVEEVADRGEYRWFKLSGINNTFSGWVRGDLIREASLIPETASQSPRQPAATPSEPEPLAVQPLNPQTASLGGDAPVTAPNSVRGPLDSRADWSKFLYSHVNAINACLSVSSAQPSSVLFAKSFGRDLLDIIILDASGRQWDCVIGEEAGTPVRFDPIVSGNLSRLPGQPRFALASTGEPTDDPCWDVEEIFKSDLASPFGYLSYPLCTNN